MHEATVAQSILSIVHFVVTEYGIAQLYAKTLRERAHALIQIAHPAFRGTLAHS